MVAPSLRYLISTGNQILVEQDKRRLIRLLEFGCGAFKAEADMTDITV
jgi:hypothetical protein